MHGSHVCGGVDGVAGPELHTPGHGQVDVRTLDWMVLPLYLSHIAEGAEIGLHLRFSLQMETRIVR